MQLWSLVANEILLASSEEVNATVPLHLKIQMTIIIALHNLIWTFLFFCFIISYLTSVVQLKT